MTSARHNSKRTEPSFSNLEASSTHLQQNFVHCAFGNPVDVGCFSMLILALPEPLANPSPFSLIWDSHIWNQFNM